jgi:hypothetical protein
LTSLRMSLAIAMSRSDSSRLSRFFASSPIGWAQYAAIDLSSIVTARETGLRRAPLQAGQGTSRMKPANFSLLESDSASAWRRST